MNKKILKYAKDEGWTLRHDVDALVFAAKETANNCDVEPMSVIKFMLGDIPLVGHYTHSYGFHTREGRSIREFFSTKYEEYGE